MPTKAIERHRIGRKQFRDAGFIAKLVEHQLATLPYLGHNRHRLVFEKTAPT
jgi:hypothetical protein